MCGEGSPSSASAVVTVQERRNSFTVTVNVSTEVRNLAFLQNPFIFKRWLNFFKVLDSKKKKKNRKVIHLPPDVANKRLALQSVAFSLFWL